MHTPSLKYQHLSEWRDFSDIRSHQVVSVSESKAMVLCGRFFNLSEIVEGDAKKPKCAACFRYSIS